MRTNNSADDDWSENKLSNVVRRFIGDCEDTWNEKDTEICAGMQMNDWTMCQSKAASKYCNIFRKCHREHTNKNEPFDLKPGTWGMLRNAIDHLKEQAKAERKGLFHQSLRNP